MNESAQSRVLLVTTAVLIVSTFVASLLKFPSKIRSAPANHVVISEIQIEGATSTDEFVELYNPTDSEANLTNWKLLRKTASGTEEILLTTLSGSIQSHGYYLVASNETDAGFDGGVAPDTTYSGQNISDNNTVTLRDGDDDIVDLVGMGTAGTSETETVANPIDNRSIERKAFGTSTSESMVSEGGDFLQGNSEDTDNNSVDFVRHVAPAVSDPQNTMSPAEAPSGSPTVTPTVTPTDGVTPSPTTMPQGVKVLISEVQIGEEGTGNAGHDFIELYNPNDTPYNLEGHRLVKRTSGDTTDEALKSWATETILPPHSFYLWANSGWTNISTTPDTTTSATLAANNGIALRFGANDTGEIIDSVGWGEANNEYIETSAYPTNPDSGKSLERKACASSTAESMVGEDSENGNGQDSDNNANDFVLRDIPDPQNQASSPETPGCATDMTPTPTQSVSPTPTATVSPTPTPSTSVTPTPSPSPSPSSTATPTPTLTPTMTPTPTLTPTTTPSNTPTPTQSPTSTPTVTPTLTPTEIPTKTPTPTVEPTVTSTPSPTPTVTPDPEPRGFIIGLFNFPGRQKVCRLTFVPVRFFFSYMFFPKITCN